MLGWFDEKGIRKLLKIPSNRRIPLVITLGYPASDLIRQKVRKPIDKIRFLMSMALMQTVAVKKTSKQTQTVSDFRIFIQMFYKIIS
jgi:hypothetical protein